MTYATTDATVRIGGSTLLDGVSVEVAPGEVVAVAGPNGAGKSTLIGVLAGDVHAGAAASLDGRAVGEWPRGELARRRAVMGTDSSVAFGYTVREVALMGRMPHGSGTPSVADGEIVDELLRSVDCAGLADRVYATLSTGERQRVQLARAVVQVKDVGGGTREPRYLLLDEPTSSLDPAHQHAAMQLLRQLADAGHGVLAVLHDLNLAAAYADRIVLLRDGRVVTAGSPEETIRADVLESVFDIHMLVIPHPGLQHPVVVAGPAVAAGSSGSSDA